MGPRPRRLAPTGIQPLVTLVRREAPAPARGLADALGQAMTGLGLAFDRRPFRPHVTLYRQVRSRPELPLPPPLAWSPKEFVLIESVRGQPYQVLRSWPVG